MAGCQQDYDFPTGSIVYCTTRFGDVKGEVVAFDLPSQLLALKTPIGSTKSKVTFVNLRLITDIKVEKEPVQSAQQSQTSLPHINFTLIERRIQEEVEKRRRSICSANVSSEGQRIFVAIRKTIDDVCWEGEKIVVLGRAVVQPPYRCDNVQTRTNIDCTKNDAENTVLHVRKIIDKFWTKSSSNDSNAEKSPAVHTSSSTPSFTKPLYPAGAPESGQQKTPLTPT